MEILRIIVAHMVGEYLLQNDWMQAKTSSWKVAGVHGLLYALAWIVFTDVATMPIILIAAVHATQDRYALHLKWMKLIKSSPSDKWPNGPWLHDQAWHTVQILVILGWYYN